MNNNGSVLRSIEEIPFLYRQVFSEYPCFNVVQSAVLDSALKTDNPLVVSAPTGSGKTAVFELAIVRHLMQNQDGNDLLNNKIIYVSPIKALCVERLMDWHKKFSRFGLKCISITSDTDEADFRNIMQYNLFVATAEKWDVLTRKWRDNSKLIDSIKLFFIDEVHLLNADSRGATLEVIVSRMKTALETRSFRMPCSIRIIAVSATIPNIEDITEWICKEGSAEKFSFSDETRPVKLNKLIIGYHFNPQSQSVFKFDMSLTYKLPALIANHAEGKPTMIFCNTRKSVEMTANHLLTNMQVKLGDEIKGKLKQIAESIEEIKLKQLIMNGIAIHHAGLVQENRHKIEQGFRSGVIPVLVTTSTLALGVNLPAHLVIVKCTKGYIDGSYRDYDEMTIFQMIGRAGRCQFDTSATALILTSNQDKAKYDRMLECSQPVESNLHKHLTEHLNAEVVLKTITDLDVAMRWLSSTYLYVRARKCPEKYKFPAGLSKEKVDKKLLDMCQIDLNKLVKHGMIQMTDAIEITPTRVGEIMAKYYIAFDTMKLFTEITGAEILKQILAIVSRCKEFSEVYLRTNDKRTLNILNKNKHKQSNRFPLNGRIKTVDMKVNVIIQAVLGNLDISDQSILCDSAKIMRNCQRISKCLIEYLESRDKVYNALLSSIILAKCFKVKLWESSPYVSKQLTGVGHVLSTLLAKAGKTTFKEIAESNPRHIEMIINRKPPFGNTLVEEASHMPEYTIALEKQNNMIELNIVFQNPSVIEEKCTVDINAFMVLLVGDSENNILLYEKYSHLYMLENLEVKKTINLESPQTEWVMANLISEDLVGIDREIKLDIPQPASNKTPLPSNKMKQTYLDNYMASVKPKKTNTKKKAELNNNLSNLTNTLANKDKRLQDINNIGNKITNLGNVITNVTSTLANNDKQLEKINNIDFFTKNKDSKTREQTSTQNQKISSTSNLQSTIKSVNQVNDMEERDLNFSKFEQIFDNNIAETNQNVYNSFGNMKNQVATAESFDYYEPENDTNLKNIPYGRNSPHEIINRDNENFYEEDETSSNMTDEREPIFNELNMKVYDQLKRKYAKYENKAENVDKITKQVKWNNKENHDILDSIDIFSPYAKQTNKNTNSIQETVTSKSCATSSIPSKSIKWRSPLVHASPIVRYSPKTQINGDFNRSGNCTTKPRIPEFSNSFEAINSQKRSLLKTETPRTRPKTPLKRKNPFPLSDQEFIDEKDNANDRSLSDSRIFEPFSSQTNPTFKKRDLETSQSSVGNYYTQLMQSTQSKQDRSISRIPEDIEQLQDSKQPKKDHHVATNQMPEEFQASQDLFSEGDFPQNTIQNPSSTADSPGFIQEEADLDFSPNRLRSVAQRKTPIPEYDPGFNPRYGRSHLDDYYMHRPACPRYPEYMYPPNRYAGHPPSYGCCSHQWNRPTPPYFDPYLNMSPRTHPIWREPSSDFGRFPEYCAPKDPPRFLFSRPSQQGFTPNEERFHPSHLDRPTIISRLEDENTNSCFPPSPQQESRPRYSDNYNSNQRSEPNLSPANLGKLFAITPKKQHPSNSQQTRLPYGKTPKTPYSQSGFTTQHHLIDRLEDGMVNRIPARTNEFCFNPSRYSWNADEDERMRQRFNFRGNTQ